MGITFVPIVVMMLYSFNNAPTSRITFAWNGFTTYWYRNLTQVNGLTHAFLISLEVAILSSLISVIVEHRSRSRSDDSDSGAGARSMPSCSPISPHRPSSWAPRHCHSSSRST